MSEREIMLAIQAIEEKLVCSDLECPCGGTTSEERAALHGAVDALALELRRVRARRPT